MERGKSSEVADGQRVHLGFKNDSERDDSGVDTEP